MTPDGSFIFYLRILIKRNEQTITQALNYFGAYILQELFEL